MIEKWTPDLLTLSTISYDFSVLCNLFSNAEMRQLSASGTNGWKTPNNQTLEVTFIYYIESYITCFFFIFFRWTYLSNLSHRDSLWRFLQNNECIVLCTCRFCIRLCIVEGFQSVDQSRIESSDWSRGPYKCPPNFPIDCNRNCRRDNQLG